MTAAHKTMYEEIEQAINAHEKWIKHINTTIALSVYELDTSDSKVAENNALVEKVSQDYNCPLGKWLHTTRDDLILSSPFYHKVVELHKLFHKEAGQVLTLAFQGDNIKAKAMIAENTDFDQHSKALIETLKAWQKTSQ